MKWKGEHCKNCGREQRLAWTISDTLWNIVVPANLLSKVICLECFLKFAGDKDLTIALSNINLSGIAF
jgi:hypothetical protein